VCVRVWEAFEVKMTGRTRSRCDHRLPALSDWLGIIAPVSDAELAVDSISFDLSSTCTLHIPERRTRRTQTYMYQPKAVCTTPTWRERERGLLFATSCCFTGHGSGNHHYPQAVGPV